ncbi:hypothetical protein BH23PLA1_BH23PLA1_41320 [soil metagenome]
MHPMFVALIINVDIIQFFDMVFKCIVENQRVKTLGEKPTLPLGLKPRGLRRVPAVNLIRPVGPAG